MNFFSRNRFILWVLIILIVINISALVTFIIFFYGKLSPVQPIPGQTTQDGFSHQLLLNSKQTAIVEKINESYRIAARPISDSIKELRMTLLDELSTDKPDSSKLKQINAELCNFQMKLQNVNISQYMSLKKVCTPEQAKSLSGLYEKLYGCDRNCRMMNRGQGKGQGNGKGKGMQHHYRKGQQKQNQTP